MRSEGTSTETQLQSEKERPKLGFAMKPLVVCSLPQSQKTATNEWCKRNGKCYLRLVGSSSYGLPYGRDRIFMYWLRTKATQLKSNVIPFKDAASILREMGLTNTGKNLSWLKQVIMRCHNTILYYVEGDPFKGGESKGELIISTISGFFDKKSDASKRDSYFQISKLLFDLPDIPIDLNMIKKLGRHYTAMDLYTSLRLRLNRVQEDGSFIIFPISDLREHFGTSEKLTDHDFKKEVQQALDALDKAGFDIKPRIEGNNIIIPKKRPKNVLSLKHQLALEAFDKLRTSE